jgi:hypothetical protein
MHDSDTERRAEERVEEERARSFGWSDMFVHPDDDPRTDRGFQGSAPRSLVTCVTST